MSTLLAIWSLRLRGTLRKQRRGAAVLETVLLLVAAVVILWIIVSKFTGTSGYLNQIWQKIDSILNIKE